LSNSLCQRRDLSAAVEIVPVVQRERQEPKLNFSCQFDPEKFAWGVSKPKISPLRGPAEN